MRNINKHLFDPKLFINVERKAEKKTGKKVATGQNEKFITDGMF